MAHLQILHKQQVLRREKASTNAATAVKRKKEAVVKRSRIAFFAEVPPTIEGPLEAILQVRSGQKPRRETQQLKDAKHLAANPHLLAERMQRFSPVYGALGAGSAKVKKCRRVT